mmetsp:Transcript_19932/g.56159  ORF Transcript_19932/g.56159 Transcript_19932/m.56159 type:complete len:83 (+) Transcript_19932:1840-2088(+)
MAVGSQRRFEVLAEKLGFVLLLLLEALKVLHNLGLQLLQLGPLLALLRTLQIKLAVEIRQLLQLGTMVPLLRCHQVYLMADV